MQDAAEFLIATRSKKTLFAEALLTLGHVLRALDREDEAQSRCRRALREKPEPAQNYFDPTPCKPPRRRPSP